MGLLTYFKIGALVAALSIGAAGAWYIQGVRLDKKEAQIELLTRQLAGYKRALKILKEDAKTDAETDKEKEKIDSLTPEQFADYFNELRKRGRGESRNPESE